MAEQSDKKNYQLNLTLDELESLIDFVDTYYDLQLSSEVYSKLIKLFEESLFDKGIPIQFTEKEIKHILWAIRYLSDMHYSGDEEITKDYEKSDGNRLEKSIETKLIKALKK